MAVDGEANFEATPRAFRYEDFGEWHVTALPVSLMIETAWRNAAHRVWWVGTTTTAHFFRVILAVMTPSRPFQ
jgi:hypothetical protein